MLLNNSESLSISNPSIAFFGKKCDLKSYSVLCRDDLMNVNYSEESFFIYQLYLQFQDEIDEALVPLLKNSVENNVTVSEGILISL